MKLVLPAQNTHIETPQGIDPIWYEKLDQLFKSLSAFIEAGGAGGAYREGSYTPVLTSAGTVPTFTAIPLTGKYIKVGRLCTVQVSASNTAGGTAGAGANQLSLSLPFQVSATALTARVFAGSFLNAAATDLGFVQITAGASTATLWQQTVSGSKVDQVALNCVDFNNVTRAISFAFTYPVD